jgi:hypothetical protein
MLFIMIFVRRLDLNAKSCHSNEYLTEFSSGVVCFQIDLFQIGICKSYWIQIRPSPPPPHPPNLGHGKANPAAARLLNLIRAEEVSFENIINNELTNYEYKITNVQKHAVLIAENEVEKYNHSGYRSSESLQELPVPVCKLMNITESPDLSQMLSR